MRLYLDATSKASGQRQRAPKADQVVRVEAIISAIIANVAKLHKARCQGFHSAEDRVAVPMKHVATSRYDRAGFNQLGRTVDIMADLGLLRMHSAKFYKRRTGIEASGWLHAKLEEPDWSLAEVDKAEGEETILLALRMGRDAKGNRMPSKLVPYTDTEETCWMREEMATINSFLRAQRIELDGEPQAAVTLSRHFLLRDEGGPPSFNLHGRLYGAFWLNMKESRRDGLRINGEPIADLDFRSMFPRLAYAMVGMEPPQGDLYAIAGLEEHRDGVKRGFSALLSNTKEMMRLSPRVKKKLPPGWDAKRFKCAVAAAHPALVPLFGRDIALDLMFTESRIMMATLKQLLHQGIPALAIHDGAMVPASAVDQAMAAMEAAAMEIIGQAIPVEVKAGP